MKRINMLSVALLTVTVMQAQVAFDDWFADSTLRLDYIFAGNDHNTAIYLEELAMSDGWAGRRHNLSHPFQAGNGQVTVCDKLSGDTLYCNSFSTLFQEWKCTPEAAKVDKAFEATYLVPYPKQPVDVTVSLTDNRRHPVATLTHTVDPSDILIRHSPSTTAETRYIHQSGDPKDCIDVVIIGDGYTDADRDKFFADARRASDALFCHEPFKSLADRFNVMAVATLAADQGPDVPREGRWQRTAHRSHFDTFYSQRYLTTQAIHGIYDSIAGIPVEHVILLVNTPMYGGGGIFNQLTVTTSDHPTFKPVLVHEFGHAYAGLADEYFYAGDEDTTYPVDVEPWEQNITTMVDFDAKWADMLPQGTLIPTPEADVPDLKTLDLNKPENQEIIRRATQTVGVFEGAGYKTKGVYRPAQYCRMRVNEGDYFCPVCSRIIVNITDWYTRP